MKPLYKFTIKAYNKYTQTGPEHDVVMIKIPMAPNEEIAINEAQVMIKRDVYKVVDIEPIIWI